MKKLFAFFTVLFFALSDVSAQTDYVVHIIKEGETLTQLAAKYHTTVGNIMRLNGMDTNSKLLVGEAVNIPTSSATPATHTVAKGETLYQISRKYNVSVSQLRDWNSLSDNTIKEGQTLFLQPPATAVPAKKTAKVTEETNTVDKISDNENTSNAVVESPKKVVKAAPKKTARPVVPGDPYAAAYQSQANGAEQHAQGVSGVFKSSKGWNDKNYFILINDVAPGKMIKIQANGKTIYAKALWNLGNVKENSGLTYRISDAAAAALGLKGDSFDLVVSYFK